MDTNLLRSWLGLPPGTWPPDDRALLGLPPGPANPADAERRALALMGKLRPHQLVHPELVTEGMNRLAQALLAVTSAASVPHQLPPAAPTSRPTGPREVAYDGNLEPPRTGPRQITYSAALGPPPTRGADRPIAVANGLSSEPAAEADPILLVEPPSPAPASPQVKLPQEWPVGPPAPVAAPEPPPGLVGPLRTDRRQAYRELAGLRGMLRAWDKLRSSLADPTAGLATGGEVFEFLDGVQAVRAAAVHPGLDPAAVREVAPRVAAVLWHPLPLAVVRSLVPPQRRAVARDWASGRARFAAEYTALRDRLARSAPARPPLTAAGFLRTIARNPEWGLVLATGVVLGAAVVRLAVR